MSEVGVARYAEIESTVWVLSWLYDELLFCRIHRVYSLGYDLDRVPPASRRAKSPVKPKVPALSSSGLLIDSTCVFDRKTQSDLEMWMDSAEPSYRRCLLTPMYSPGNAWH